MTQRLRVAAVICAGGLAWCVATAIVSASDDLDEAGACVALMVPSVQGVTGSAEDAATGLRDLISKYLSGPSLRVVALDSRLPTQAAAEAREKNCEPILVMSLTRKSGGGKLTRALGQAAGGSSFYIPGGGTVGSVVVSTAAQAGLRTAAALASSTRAKDTMTVDYRLQSATGDIRFGPRTETQKASVDGEDLLTPVVARVAEAIATYRGTK